MAIGQTKKSIYNIGDSIKGCNLEQYYHYAIIDLKKMQSNGMKFVSECCNIDVPEFLEKQGRYGFVINGVFFNILKTNFPIGPYKDKNIPLTNSINIPEKYSRYYGFIGYKNPTSSSTGIFTITPIDKFNLSEANNFDFLSVCGPVLIDKDSNYEFSVSDVDKNDNIEKIGQTKIFQCISPKVSSDKILSPPQEITRCSPLSNTEVNEVTSYFHPNCTKIAAGELSHGSNLNPRTAMAFNKNTGKLYFLIIEGRENRGSGQDFINMVQTFKSIDPDITIAINLDGGGSSCMAMKCPSDMSTIISVNPNRQSPYPVGNVFAIVNN